MNIENQYDYRLSAIRLKNFMAFEDTGWIELRPITLLFGRNSSGKSAIIRALLLLKQSIEARDPRAPLIFNGRWVDLGSYYNTVHRHDVERDIIFGFRLWRPSFDEPKPPEPKREDGEPDAVFNQRQKAYEQKQKEYESRLKEYEDAGISRQWSLAKGPSVDVDDEQSDLELTFGQIDGSRVPVLKRLAISGWRKPAEGEPTKKLVFSCERGADGTWQPASEIPLDYDHEEGEDEHRVTRHYSQFSAELWKRFAPRMASGPIPDRLWVSDQADLLKSDRPPDWEVVDKALEFFHQRLVGFLEGMVYLPPLREEPRRYYRADHEWVRELRGEEGGLSAVNRWMDSVGLHGRISTKDLQENEGIISVYVDEVGHDRELRVNLRDVGSGVSQLLPVLAKSLAGALDKFVVIEQPELHLHPGAQAHLADLFIEMISHKPRPAPPTFLLETHSENLLLRFRVRLAQTQAYPDQEFKLYQEDFGALFVERSGEVTRVEKIEFDELGAYVEQPKGFVEFFGDDFAELQALRRARSDATAMNKSEG